MFDRLKAAIDALTGRNANPIPVLPVDPNSPVDPNLPPSPHPVPVPPEKPGLLRSLVGRVSSAWVAWLITVAVTTVFTWLGFKSPAVPPVPDVPIWQQGWVSDPDAVDAIKDTLETPLFRDTPAGKTFRGNDDDAPLWKAAIKATGSMLAAGNQGQVGSCVSFGTGTAIDYLQCVSISQGGNLEYIRTCKEQIYGVSRVQIGQGRIRGDGSVGAWAAKGVQEYGVVSRTVQLDGKYDLREYSESRCRDWGNRGAPSDLEPIGKKSLVRGISQVRTADEAIKALAQGYPIAVCSNQGFSSTRDGEGFLRASGSWGHCMAVIGYKGGKRPGFLIQNSWGADWLNGPMGSEPIPDGSFWAD